MNNRMAKWIAPGFWLNFLVLLLFTAYSARYSYQLAGVMLVVCLVLYLIHVQFMRLRKRELTQFVEQLSGQLTDAAQDSITNFPLPSVVVAAANGNIVWCNDQFTEITGEAEQPIQRKIDKLIPGFDTKWITDGRTVYPSDVVIGDRHYTVYGNLSKPQQGAGAGIFLSMYWVDCTEYSYLKEDYARTRTVVGIVTIDNYDELMKNSNDEEKSTILANIDKYLGEWYRPAQGVWRKFDRDKYILLFEEGWLDTFIEEKFTILDDVRSIQSPSGVNATLSIGIGKDGDSLASKYRFASLAMDMALSRGGDQVVIKHKYSFDFFGGISKEVEKQTKVKSRVVANALGQLFRDSSQVFIMGHRVSDLDCIGSAIGLVCAARCKETAAKIVVNRETTLARNVVEKMEELEEYEHVFIDPDEAMVQVDGNTLLIIVDTNRPDYVESPELLQSANKVAVIDHHRRAASYIENSAVNLHEPYASSACELVTELLQYMVYNQKVLKEEAECLMGGMFLDTKGFTIKAGVRTFEAAAYLRRAGAEMTEVKAMFQSDFDSYLQKQKVISYAENRGNGIIISAVDFEVDRAMASKAADEMLDLADIEATFVVFYNAQDVVISARSHGKINVQVIMENLGGGGSLASAGAQIRDGNVEDVKQQLIEAIDDYMAE